VNCSLTTKSEALAETLGKFSTCTILQYSNANESSIDSDIDAIVISGSKARIVKASYRDEFNGVVNLVRNSDLPTLGICFGHQLLCWSLGAEVGRRKHEAFKGFAKIRVLVPDGLFSGSEKDSTVPLAENHYDYVKKRSLDKAGFVLLADSRSCKVEAVRHKSKPFYGVQFHPERIEVNGESHPEGHRIIENFYRNVVKR